MSHYSYPQQLSNSSSFHQPALDGQQSMLSSFQETVSDNQGQPTAASFGDSAFGNQQPSFYPPEFNNGVDRHNNYHMVSGQLQPTDDLQLGD
jgi:hypothetical protein